jgi:hypothetical protein
MSQIKDRTALIPFVLFAIFGGLIAYSIIKGTRKVKIEESVTDDNVAKL